MFLQFIEGFFQGSKLGPGTYNFKSFAEETVNKMTSTRGPYDLFSGDRNKPITVGYFAAPVSKTVDDHH